jgi:hypothetical protein
MKYSYRYSITSAEASVKPQQSRMGVDLAVNDPGPVAPEAELICHAVEAKLTPNGSEIALLRVSDRTIAAKVPKEGLLGDGNGNVHNAQQ